MWWWMSYRSIPKGRIICPFEEFAIRILTDILWICDGLKDPRHKETYAIKSFNSIFWKITSLEDTNSWEYTFYRKESFISVYLYRKQKLNLDFLQKREVPEFCVSAYFLFRSDQILPCGYPVQPSLPKTSDLLIINQGVHLESVLSNLGKCFPYGVKDKYVAPGFDIQHYVLQGCHVFRHVCAGSLEHVVEKNTVKVLLVFWVQDVLIQDALGVWDDPRNTVSDSVLYPLSICSKMEIRTLCYTSRGLQAYLHHKLQILYNRIYRNYDTCTKWCIL